MNPKIIVLLLIIVGLISCRSVKNEKGIIEPAKQSTNLMTDSMVTLTIDSLVIDSNLVITDLGSDSLMMETDTFSTIIDSVEIARLEAEHLKEEETQRIREQKIRALENDIERLKNKKKKAAQKYQDLQKYFERYIKVEATNRLLNINHYSTNAQRLNQNLNGLLLAINSNLSNDLSTSAKLQDIEKLALSVVAALKRYQKVSNIDYNQLKTSIQIQGYGIDTKMEGEIRTMFKQLNIPCQFSFINDENISLQIEVISNHFFEQNYQEWLLEDQRISRQIRMKEIKIKKM